MPRERQTARKSSEGRTRDLQRHELQQAGGAGPSSGGVDAEHTEQAEGAATTETNNRVRARVDCDDDGVLEHLRCCVCLGRGNGAQRIRFSCFVVAPHPDKSSNKKPHSFIRNIISTSTTRE
jgi:hypothetical protein